LSGDNPSLDAGRRFINHRAMRNNSFIAIRKPGPLGAVGMIAR
jgi:hypothetical protein